MRPIVVVLLALAALAAPATASAHGLATAYQSELPLAVYVAGAAAVVALSFLFVLSRNTERPLPAEGRIEPVAAWIRVPLRVLGLVAWLWIVIQLIAGGSSSAEVATLFLWVYGWVGVAMLSAFVGPVWRWLDPFTTLYDIGAWVGRRAGLSGLEPAPIPPALRGWPAVVGFAFVVWLELVLGLGSRILAIVLVGYTFLTLAMMTQFGRDPWRTEGETFGVWFGLLNRMATKREVEGRDDVVRGVTFGTGLLEARWSVAEVVLVALGVGSILYDGLSQTEPWVAAFGFPGPGPGTLLLAATLGIIVAVALAAARFVGRDAMGSGLLPIAVGYLVAHYLTYLLVDGQRIIGAISDPLQNGSDLFGTAFYEPTGDFLAPGLVWTMQLAAVVGGHMLGAWAGHARVEAPEGRVRRRSAEAPLALVMVGLTTLTLWSLGQAIVAEPTDEPTAAVLDQKSPTMNSVTSSASR